MEVEAASLQRFGQLTGVVGGEEHQRDLFRLDRAELGDRHLVVGEELQQQCFGLHLEAVDLVDQQHDGIVGPDRLEQRTGEEKLVGEDVVGHLGPLVVLAPLGLDAKQLLLVVPLVERLGLVEPFVTLETNQAGAGDLGHALRQLRLARARRPLHEDRLLEAISQEDDAGSTLVRKIVDPLQLVSDRRDIFEAKRHVVNVSGR